MNAIGRWPKMWP